MPSAGEIPTWLQVMVCCAHLTQPCCDFYIQNNNICCFWSAFSTFVKMSLPTIKGLLDFFKCAYTRCLQFAQLL